MQAIYTISEGDMWASAVNGVITILGSTSWSSLMKMMGTFATSSVVYLFMQQRDPMVFIKWGSLLTITTSILLVPKQSVQIIDMTKPETVYQVDNVPSGLATVAGLSTSIGHGLAQLFDYALAKPDAVTYSKTGMLFGSELVGYSTNFSTQDPVLAEFLPKYVENCVESDISLAHKYSLNTLMNSKNIYQLIFSNPSVVRGLFATNTTTNTTEYYSCKDAATKIQSLMGTDTTTGGTTWNYYVQKLFYGRQSPDTIMTNLLPGSYNYFYGAGATATSILRQNILINSLRSGVTSFGGKSGDTANLLNLSTETAQNKQRLSWATTGKMAAKWLPLMQSMLMLILVLSFPLVVAISVINHKAFGFATLLNYAKSFIYLQTWPIMFAIINFCSSYYIKAHQSVSPLVLSNVDQLALQHSDVQVMAGYLCVSVPYFAYLVTKGASAMMTHGINGMTSAISSTATQQSSTSADGNWSFNNMQMDNVSANKWDTNKSVREGQSSYQMANGSTYTQTADGSSVYSTHGAISDLPSNISWGKQISSSLNSQARESYSRAQSMLQGANHSVSSGLSKLMQLGDQRGSSDSTVDGYDQSQSANILKAKSKMMSAVEGYAEANHISKQEAASQLASQSTDMHIGADGSAGFDSSKTIWGKAGELVVGGNVKANVNAGIKGSDTDAHNKSVTNTNNNDNAHTKNSQFAKDFKEGLDVIDSFKTNKSGNHSTNESNNLVNQIASDFKDAQTKYSQYSDAENRASELADQASKSQSISAEEKENLNQQFVEYVKGKYGNDADNLLTNVSSPEVAAKRNEAVSEFISERVSPIINSDYDKNKTTLGGELPVVSDTSGVNPSSNVDSNNAVVLNNADSNIPRKGDVTATVRSRTSETKAGIKNESDNLNTEPSEIKNENGTLKHRYENKGKEHTKVIAAETERQKYFHTKAAEKTKNLTGDKTDD